MFFLIKWLIHVIKLICNWKVTLVTTTLLYLHCVVSLTSASKLSLLLRSLHLPPLLAASGSMNFYTRSLYLPPILSCKWSYECLQSSSSSTIAPLFQVVLWMSTTPEWPWQHQNLHPLFLHFVQSFWFLFLKVNMSIIVRTSVQVGSIACVWLVWLHPLLP